MNDDLQKLATRLREQVIGIDGWLLVENGGGGLLAVPVVDDWEATYCPPKDEQPKNEDVQDLHAFPSTEFGGVRLEKSDK